MLITLSPLINLGASSQKYTLVLNFFFKLLINYLVPLVQMLFQGRSTLKLFRIIFLPVTNYHMRLSSQLKFRITNISKILYTYLSAHFTEKHSSSKSNFLAFIFPSSVGKGFIVFHTAYFKWSKEFGPCLFLSPWTEELAIPFLLKESKGARKLWWAYERKEMK